MQNNRFKGMAVVQAQSSFTSLMGSQTMLAPTNLVVAVMREVRRVCQAGAWSPCRVLVGNKGPFAELSSHTKYLYCSTLTWTELFPPNKTLPT